MSRRIARAVVAVIRAALMLYPAGFRRRFRDEIVESARTDLEQAKTARAFRARSTRELIQVVAGILPEHRSARARRHTSGRTRWPRRLVQSTGGDIRQAARGLRKAPWFTTVAIGVLALGIGSSAAVFSVVDAVVLRGLPFDEHDRLAVVLEFDPKGPGVGYVTTIQAFLDWRAHQQSFQALSAAAWTSVTMRGENDEPLHLRGQRVTHNFFETLRVRPLLGRTFTLADEPVTAPRVVAISYGLWQRHFALSQDVIGQHVTLGGQPWEVVAVLPPGFSYPVASAIPIEFYVPARYSPEDVTRSTGWNYMWTVIGRLHEGVSMAQADAELYALSEVLDAEDPTWYGGNRARVMPLHEHLVGGVRTWLLLLLGSVTLVLLIACANVANLMLARATVRERELGIRTALGAGRWRLTRMLTIEGLLLTLTGAMGGLLLAKIAVAVITASIPEALPRVAAIDVDLRVIGAAATAAIVMGIGFGLLPALQASRVDVTRTLSDGGRAMTSGRGATLRSLLVVSEVALALMLLVGAGLFIGSFAQVMRIDTGFDYRNVMTFGLSTRVDPVALSAASEGGREARAAFYRSLGLEYRPRLLAIADAVREVPGVESAAVVNGGVPLTGNFMRMPVRLPGGPELSGDDYIDLREVSAGYLELLRVPLLRGRLLTPQDVATDAKVLVINASAAARYWPGDNALGKQLSHDIEDGMRTVVGIVGDIRHRGPEHPKRQEAYVPIGATTGASLVIRTSSDPMLALPAIKHAVWSVDPDQYVPNDAMTLERHLDQMLAQRRFNMTLLTLLGVMALGIAAAGVYGVMAYVVSQRTQEIGVRMALGAKSSDIVSMIVRSTSLLVATGLLIGASAAWSLAFAVQPFLFLVASHDWRVFVGAALTLATAGLVACAIPARRASRVDPLAAIRSH